MKKNALQKLAIIFVMLVAVNITYSQMKNIGQFTAGGVDDANKLVKAYLTPWANALGTSLSGGWYNTAKVHKLGGFDLTFTMNMAFVPQEDKTFDLSKLELSAGASYSGNTAPTAAGKAKAGPELSYYGIPLYRTPKGTGLGFIPSPMLQAGIGLVKGTEIDGRYMPGADLGSLGSFGLWGIGLKHDILQWLPLASKLPALNVSIQGGYTKLSYRKALSFQPEDMGVDAGNVQTSSDITFDDQELDLYVKSFTANLLVSVNLPVISFFGGIGIANTKTDLGMKGYYPVPTVDNHGDLIVTDASVGNADPISLDIKNNNGSPTKPRFNVGLRFKMGPITIHGDYTKANYSNVTAGLGISFR